MEKRVSFNASEGKVDGNEESSLFLDSGRERVLSLEFISFPETISHIVADYLPDTDQSYSVKCALSDEQPITFCLSQNVDSKLISCWSAGFLPPEQPWASLDTSIDKEYRIHDIQGCLGFLGQRIPRFCRIRIDVLVVKLNPSSMDSPQALDNLRSAIIALDGHLNSVKRVVFSITEHACYCFSFKDPSDRAIAVSTPVNPQRALLQVVDDLDACCKAVHTLSDPALFAFYFTSTVTPPSKIYLARFVNSLMHPISQNHFEEGPLDKMCGKVMRVCQVKSLDDFHHINHEAIRLCHAVQVDASALSDGAVARVHDFLGNAFSYQNHSFIERIVIDSKCDEGFLHLPQPSAFPTGSIQCSALIEITLSGGKNTLDLAKLNNHFFPNLTLLSVVGGCVLGHLDSQSVPRLKTLNLQLGNHSYRNRAAADPYSRDICQSLIGSGRLWQLVATRLWDGWSLASYDEPNTSPQDDVKDDTPHSPLHSQPMIRELLLVGTVQDHFNEWESQLKGVPPLEASDEEHDSRLLVWAPQRVQTIVACCTTKTQVVFNFQQTIPGQTLILDSLTCNKVAIELDSALLPCLKSLEVKNASANFSGTFHELRTLSFYRSSMKSPWQLDAPKLESLRCYQMDNGVWLSVCPPLLPKLSSLSVTLIEENHSSCPSFDFKEFSTGLSTVNRVVLHEGTDLVKFFDQWQVKHVTHLEIDVSPLQLPEGWSDLVWQCETLTINVYPLLSQDLQLLEQLDKVVLPALPQVKMLTVTETNCSVYLDKEMPQLTDCTVPSPKSLGPKLRCPALRCIRFTQYLSENEKKQCLDRNTYSNVGAQPKWVYLDYFGEVHKMAWDVAPRENETLSLVRPLALDDEVSISHE